MDNINLLVNRLLSLSRQNYNKMGKNNPSEQDITRLAVKMGQTAATAKKGFDGSAKLTDKQRMEIRELENAIKTLKELIKT